MPIPPELATACADVRLADAADTIAGRPARYVAAPDSTAEASALLRAAAALGLTVVPRGAGRLQHWGNPPDSCDLIVDTRRLDRIVEHAPADFTVTVQAGVRLRDLERTLAPSRQTVALFPPRPAYAGTVGGLIATNVGGLAPVPLRHAARPAHRHHRGPRGRHDRRQPPTPPPPADGTWSRCWPAPSAASGLITEATFRLEPTPQVSGSVALNCDDPEHAERLVEEVSDPSIAPIGDRPALAVGG